MLEQFFSGILTQLQAEIDLINSIVPHNVTKGSLNEASFRKIVESFIPSRYDIGSGIVIDSHGNKSNQIDLIIFDKFFSSKLFRTYSQVIYPVETVFACIEIKTKLDKAELEEVAKENINIANLKHYSNFINTIRPSKTVPKAIDFTEHETRPPLTFLLAYHTSTVNPLTVKRWFEENSNKKFLPDLTLFLDLGMAVIRTNPIEKENFDFIITPVRNNDIGYQDNDIAYVKEPNKLCNTNGRTYKSSSWKSKNGGYPLIMPEKALLSFLINLVRTIDVFPKDTSFDPTPYLKEYSDEGIEVIDNN